LWENSGDNDEVGTAYAQVSPEQWIDLPQGGEFTATIQEEKSCGENPYTAHFVVSSNPRPY